MIIDEILKKSGDFGPAQWCLLCLFSVVNIFSAFHYFAQTFITLTPKNVCGENSFYYTEVGNTSGDVFDGINISHREFETLINELNWTCEEKWKSAVIQSTFFIGSVVGTFVLGIVADTYGRIPTLKVANILAITGNLMTIYLNKTVWWLSISRFVAGLATDSNFFMMYIIGGMSDILQILVMEYIRPNMRTFGLNLCIGIWYCVGCMLTPWLAILTKNWRNFLLSISIPTLLIPFACIFVPESAQWLLSVGKTDDAVACFKKLASFNKTEISDEFIEQFKASINQSKSCEKKGNLWGLFKTPRLRRKTCILIFKTMVLTLSYDAMSRNIEGLGLDPFVIFTITSASIFPSCLFILYLQDKVGRKAMAVFSLFLTAIFNFGQGIFLIFCQKSFFANAIIGLLGRFFVNIAYNSGTQYAAELIPTQVRGQGLAAMHVVGYGAAFFSPHILYLSNFWKAAPESILAAVSLSGAVFCLFLPETLSKSLPITLEDGEIFGENEKVWDFIKQKKQKN